MVPDLNNEELMKRFLVGDVNPNERERLEQRFMEDPEYFEALCALESELLLSHLSGELPEPWRVRFESSFSASPARRRQVEEMQALVATLSALPGTGTAAETRPRRRARWRSFGAGLGIAFGSAAAILAVLVGGWLLRREASRPKSAGLAGAQSGAAEANPTATLLLLPGVARADSTPQVNIFRIPPGTETIALRLTVPAQGDLSVQATLRRVGGSLLPVSGAPEVRRVRDEAEVIVRVPTRLLPPDDYLLTLSSATPDRESIATRFFSLVK